MCRIRIKKLRSSPACARAVSAGLLMRRFKTPFCFIKHFYALAVLCVCAVSVCNAQPSQSDASRLRVFVTDTQQRRVAGAVCAVQSGGDIANVVAIATTDEQGIASFPATLTAGNYTLRVESQGFQTFNRKDVVIKVGAVNDITVSLRVADVSESVTVAAPSDEATNAQAGARRAAGHSRRES